MQPKPRWAANPDMQSGPLLLGMPLCYCRYRGGLNMMFQLAATLGILIAQLSNHG